MLFEVFKESANESLTGLKTAIEEGDMQEISNYAHSIKGSAANLRIEIARELAYEVEMAAKNSADIDYMAKYNELNEIIKNIEMI